MKDIARPLINDEQIVSFLEAIDFRNYFSIQENIDIAFHGMNDIDAMLAKAITLIKQANNDLLDVVDNNSLESDKHRSHPYKTDESREKLRNTIFEELINHKRVGNDEEICLGTGGMLPSSGKAKMERQAIIIIGLPASGKSRIAAKVSDYYDAVLIDSDFAKRKIPEFFKTNGATLVHKESKIIIDEILKAAISNGVNLVLPIIGSEFDGVKGTINSLKRHKYSVRLILVELDRVKATQRALRRFIQTNRYVPLSMILDDYANNPSLVFYKLLSNSTFNNLPMALIDTDVPFGTRPNMVIQRKFSDIHKII